VLAAIHHMPKADFYFFCLYNAIFKDGVNIQTPLKPIYGRGPRTPEERVIWGLFFSTWLWTFVIRLLVILLFRPHFKILFIGPYECLIPLLSYAFYYFYFIDSNRYADLYAIYRSTDKSKQKQVTKKIVIVMILPLILIPVLVWCSVFCLQIDLIRR
jgi:hypothetical protein